jgi:hypothetical protein
MCNLPHTRHTWHRAEVWWFSNRKCQVTAVPRTTEPASCILETSYSSGTPLAHAKILAVTSTLLKCREPEMIDPISKQQRRHFYKPGPRHTASVQNHSIHIFQSILWHHRLLKALTCICNELLSTSLKLRFCLRAVIRLMI